MGTLIHFTHCPDFATVRLLCKEYYVVRTCKEGVYAICLELSANGKVNTHTI